MFFSSVHRKSRNIKELRMERPWRAAPKVCKIGRCLMGVHTSQYLFAVRGTLSPSQGAL